MKLLFVHVLLALVVFLGATDPDILYDVQDTLDTVPNDDAAAGGSPSLEKKFEDMQKMMAALSRQVMLQQLFVEERIRSDADSGVKQVRHNNEGTRNYYGETHTGAGSVLSIHDHSNNDRTVGMGEFIAVLNGVEFRTRHNDYRLYMPHGTSGDYHAVENIPFPEVPPEVTSKATVAEQVTEMREWFKAFKDQDHTVRDYRKYFKPVICYMEGAWTLATEGAIDEGFDSDRHFIDAKSWFDLHEKIRFTSYAGRKDNLENYSFLPTAIMNVTENGVPQFAQWNYRIVCSPIKRDIPLNRLRAIDELGPRMARQRTYHEYARSRSARFQLNPIDRDTFTERFTQKWGHLDEIMSEIPGKDNYQGNLTDEAFDLSAHTIAPGQTGKLRADRYHRWYKVQARGAMGTSIRHRGFADESLFMAMTTQPKVAGMEQEFCKGYGKNKVCKYIKQKWSYAIPLEIIYLTPLSKWNPYHLKHWGVQPQWKTVTKNGRNGDTTPSKAYNGTHSRLFYQTPVEFFAGNEVGSGAADTTKNSVGVLDPQGNVKICKASGTRILFPPILGLGSIRQRYPIAPVHQEGSATRKEVEALKDLVLQSKSYGYILREPLNSGPVPTEPVRKAIKLQIQLAQGGNGPHTHELSLTADDVDFIKSGGAREVYSTQAAGHSHFIAVKWQGGKYQKFYIGACDNKRPPDGNGWRGCWDLHSRNLLILPDS